MQFVVNEVRYAQQAEHFIEGLQPYAHQARTLHAIRQAITRGETICIENTSVTGSGKTLANFAAAILDGVRTCGVYPTNELMQDQAVSLYPHLKGRIELADSEGLDMIMDEQEHIRTHAHALSWATGTHLPLVVLTNPDVLYLAMYNLYGRMFSTFAAAEGARIFQNLPVNYPIFAFDEFHLYTAKQMANAAFIMGTMRELFPGKPHIFIFSSATPQQQFREYVQRLGIPIIPVTDEPSDQPQDRVVCEPLTVRFMSADLLRWHGGDAIRERLDEILSWADRQTPPARGVVIVDSVYEAKRLARELRARQYMSDEIGEVHGYIAKEERADALLRRFSVGTTTIDVGVDLTDKKSKEFLVCEARSAAQAIQRIGRLGRHGREPEKIRTPNTAWVAVPEYVYNYLAQRGSIGMTVSRGRLNELLEHAYLGDESFFAYTRIYSPLEAVAACERVQHLFLPDSAQEAQEKMHRLAPLLYQRDVPESQEQAEEVYEKYQKAQLAVWHKFGVEIKGAQGRNRHFLSDLESFRGGMESDFTVAIYDDLDREAGFKPVKTYALPFVLRRAVGTELSEEQFHALVKQRHPQQAEAWLAPILKQRQRLLGYVHVQDLVEEKASEWYFEILQERIGLAFQQVLRLQGLSIGGGTLQLRTGAKGINGALKKRTLNCWVSEHQSFALKEQKHLPPLFAIYPLHARQANGRVQTWSLAFGLDAFFLDCITSNKRMAITRKDDAAIIL